ncbi:hypothetical protein [Winogradskyella rapida]|uniref:Uncharacterized protein n=1 Tax=Winogradskyella rapida TaxID=549701 RepID=A0ABW3KQW6_9FLAO
MKSKIYLVLFALIIGNMTFAQKKVQIPYFETLSGTEICGTKNCNPTNGIWQKIKGGYLFDGDLTEIFGRKFKKGIFINSKCASRKPTENEFTTLKSGSLKGTLKTEKKKEFDSKINADLSKIINDNIDADASVKAELLAELKRTIESKSNSKIELEYKIVQIKNNYLDNEIDECQKSLKKKERVIIGVSVITVSGSWNSETLKDVFATFEANASAYETMTAELKTKYELDKEKALKAKFDPFSMIFNVSYLFAENE